MKKSPQDLRQLSLKAWSSFKPLWQLLRAPSPWLLFFAALLWTSLAQAQLSLIGMRDSFDYTVSNIDQHAPDVAPPGYKWTTNSDTGSSVAAAGTQANLIVNNGTLGAQNAIANFAFAPNGGTFYTLRIIYNFNSYVASTDCWAGFGLSTNAGGGYQSGNIGPWMLIRPQPSAGTTAGAAAFIGTTQKGSSWSPPASYYAGPITATVTWNTSTGEAKYYINDLLQWTATTTLPSGQTYYAYFHGYHTGSAVSVHGIALTSQPLPLPASTFCPPMFNNFDYLALFDSGAGTASWATAKSHLSGFHVPNEFCSSWLIQYYPPYTYTDAQVKSCLQWIKNNNLKLVLGIQSLTYTGTCASGEGYQLLGDTQTLVTRVNGTLGATVDEIHLDEPMSMGHESKCHLSIAECANEVWQTIGVFKAVWPNVKVSESEVLYGSLPLSDLQAWIPAFNNAAGNSSHQSLAYMEDDMDWRAPLSLHVPFANACVQAGVSYGIFFTGDCVISNSNMQWMQAAFEAIQLYNASALPIPNKVAFATWDPFPAGTNAILPETSPSSMSYLINYYYTSPYSVEPPPVPFQRLNKGGSGHFYTASPAEVISAEGYGWGYEAIAGGIYATAHGARGLVPLYRYCRAGDSCHAYAVTQAQINAIIANGFYYEFVAGYVFPDASNGGVAFYGARSGGDYYYTEDYNTYRSLVNSGWTDLGTLCWLMPRWQP